MNVPRRSRSALTRATVLVATAALLLTACGGDDEPSAAPPSPTPTATTPPPPPPPPPPVDPLTGVAPQPTAPLVAIKIDDAPLARPFLRGLESASVVYVELVEGGATRMLALWSQPPADEVGPIRSFRDSDTELLAQYGKPAVGFSGANSGVLAEFRKAVRAGQLVEVSYENRPDLYRIGERRRDAKNFFARPEALARAGQGATPAKDMGWTYAPAPRPDAGPATSARVVFSDRESVDLAYDAAAAEYSVLRAGAPMNGARPHNVVVQQVQVRASGYTDVTGAATPYSVTIGGGPVHVLRDGKVVTGQWQRPDAASPTRLLDGAGQPIALKPGPTWVLLQPVGLPFSAR